MSHPNKYKMKSESMSKTERILYGIVVTTAIVVVLLCLYTVLMD